MKIVLSEKLEASLQSEGMRELELELKNISAELKINLKKIETMIGGWVSVEYDGEDSGIFTEVLRRDYGVAPVGFSMLELGNIYRGFIVDSGKVGYGLYLDIGILSPSRCDGLYPLHLMRAQLSDGTTQPLRKITKRFCLYDGLPLRVKIKELESQERVKLTLTDGQEAYFKDLEKYSFDRVIVIGALIKNVNSSIQRAGIDRDLIKVERLSLTCSVLTCKLGTEAPGVISTLGPQLAAAKLYSFIPGARTNTRD